MKSLIDPAQVVALRNSGHTYEEIEAKLGINRSTLYGIVMRYIHGKGTYVPKPKAEPKKHSLPDRKYHPIWEKNE